MKPGEWITLDGVRWFVNRVVVEDIHVGCAMQLTLLDERWAERELEQREMQRISQEAILAQRRVSEATLPMLEKQDRALDTLLGEEKDES